MANYQPYLISEFKTGIHTYLQPWIRPLDAFEPLTNAYIYRGTVNKRMGYSQFGADVPDGNPIMGIMNFVDQATGIISLVIATTVNLYKYDPGTNAYVLVGTPPTFTGNITNFFNWTNWQDIAGDPSYLWMVNNRDPVTRYDGTNASQPTITIDGAGQTITTALDVKVYKQRLLLIRPTLSIDGVQNQSIYWSAVANDSLWRVDIAGQGGFIAAPTDDTIMAAEFLRDVLVVFFTNSTWIFRYTGNDSDPFRWDKINDSKSTNSPYGSIQYDERSTSIGKKGLIAADGVNVQRYDVPIIDYYEKNFDQRYFNQFFAQRYDNLSQAWMFYVSAQRNPTNFPLVGGVAPGSDKALIYNFLENTWATYDFPIPLTCMGTYQLQTGMTWSSLTQQWQNTDIPWTNYSQQSSPILLAGDTTGHVYHMDDQLMVTDNGTAIIPDIISTRWNPVMQAGQKTQFGYIDIYYYISSIDPTDPISVTLNFYVDNSDNVAATRTLTLDGPSNSSFAFKRIYINLVGEFVQMEIDPNENSFMQFLGFVLWARPAGRLTP